MAEGEKLDDENGNCKQCGHIFDSHIVIAEDKDNPIKGFIKCAVAHCPCHHTWEVSSELKKDYEDYKKNKERDK